MCFEVLLSSQISFRISICPFLSLREKVKTVPFVFPLECVPR